MEIEGSGGDMSQEGEERKEEGDGAILQAINANEELKDMTN